MMPLPPDNTFMIQVYNREKTGVRLTDDSRLNHPPWLAKVGRKIWKQRDALNITKFLPDKFSIGVPFFTNNVLHAVTNHCYGHMCQDVENTHMFLAANQV